MLFFLTIIFILKQPPEVFCKKRVPKNFGKLTGKHLCWGLFFNKGAGLPVTLLKKRPRRNCFSVNFATFLRTPFYRTPPVAASIFTSEVIFKTAHK